MVGKPTNPNEKLGSGGGGRLFSPRNSTTRNSQQNGYLSSPGETNEAPHFKLLTESPPSDNLPACLKYYIQLEDQLRTLSKMKTGAFHVMEKDWDKILTYIENSLRASRILFAMDTKYYLRKEIDVRVWKYSIYYFITVFRNELGTANRATDNPIDGMLCNLLRMGLQHFKELIFAIPSVLNLDLDPVFSQSAFLRGSTQKEDPTVEEELVYRLFIALGDLHRYRFEIDKSQRNIKFAIDMYTCARFIDTEKSRAYNQLGLMAKSQGDAMGVIYNFTRAWHVSNPTSGAREQLLYIYDDLYKLYNQNKPTFWFTNMKTADIDLERKKPFEIWVLDVQKYNRILASEKKVPPLRREHLNSLSDDSVFARFSFIYGHFLGMLYTKIGTEALEYVGKEMLVYLEGMIMVKNMNKFSFYIQALAMIVFQIDHLTPPRITKDNAPSVAQMDHMRNVAFDGALGISLILVEKILELIELLDWDNPMLATCTAALHVMIWWLNRRHYFLKALRKRWSTMKKVNQKNPSVPRELINDIRDNFVNSLFQLYCKFSIRERRHKSMLFPRFTKEPSGDNSVPLGILPEHIVLDGFAEVVLGDDIKRSTSCYYNSRFTQERACTYFRLKSMSYVGSIIFGSVKSTNVPIKSFEALEHFYYAFEFKTMVVIHDKMCGGELLQKQPPNNRQLRPDCNNSRIIVRKPHVEKSKKVLRSKVLLSSNPQLYTVGFEIWSHLATMGVKCDLVVQPLRVVLDTNVLIHDLYWIEKLIYLLKHPLIIPITVLLELKGLMKGFRKKSPRIRHVQLSIDEEQERMIDSMEIAEQCNHAVEFLERYRKYFRVVNVVGKQVDMYNFINQKVFDERFESTIKNDEKILETCCHLEARDRKARSKDQPLRILRNTILITGDVSLRVRAMVQDIPTRDIQAFTTWLEEATITGTPRLTPNIRRRRGNRTPRR